jgi:hypothetical protein
MGAPPQGAALPLPRSPPHPPRPGTAPAPLAQPQQGAPQAPARLPAGPAGAAGRLAPQLSARDRQAEAERVAAEYGLFKTFTQVGLWGVGLGGAARPSCSRAPHAA